jgi:hypothetical protein
MAPMAKRSCGPTWGFLSVARSWKKRCNVTSTEVQTYLRANLIRSAGSGIPHATVQPWR